jgi:hypothetical protein
VVVDWAGRVAAWCGGLTAGCSAFAALIASPPHPWPGWRHDLYDGLLIVGGLSLLGFLGTGPPALLSAYRNRRQRRELAAESGDDPTEAFRRQDGPPAGRPLAEVTDPFALEVHRPVQAEDSPPDLPELPTYVVREHDLALAEIVRGAAAGNSGIAVLVGGSSTGKTRACWEALDLLRARPHSWRLWHPIDPSRPEAALYELPSISTRTVVWLNEAQLYLDTTGGLGERVAAGLRELLRDPDRRPVLVLATLWPEFWATLTARPPAGQDDRHAQARELLASRDITVPIAFTVSQIQALTSAKDPRLALAAGARDGQVVQFLAGAPELLSRYRNAPPAATALISAAMDARRLGMGVALSVAFLEAAAPGYLTEDQWDGLDDDWLDQALDYTAADSKGTRGPLTIIRPYPSPSADSPGSFYRLADYLDQYGRQSRRSIIPPAQFWNAAATFAAPSDLSLLARAAENRGLLRDAARLRKRASRQGDTRAAAALVTSLNSLHLLGPESARWAVTHASLDDPGAVAWLLWALRNAGAIEQAEALLSRDPAAHADLDDPYAVAQLLKGVIKAGDGDQAKALGIRAAAQANLNDPYAVARLLRTLKWAAGANQVEALGARAVADANLNDPHCTASLLEALRSVGATAQFKALLARDPAAKAHLNDPGATASLLHALVRVDAADQVKALAARAGRSGLDDLNAVARLLRELLSAGATKDVDTLAARAAAHANLNDPGTVATLLEALHRIGAAGQAKALLDRDPAAHASLNNPYGVDRLLRTLQRVGATDQVKALVVRDPASHADIDDPGAVSRLLRTLRWAAGIEQAKALGARAAADTNLNDPGATAALLEALWKMGAADQVKALVARDPAARANLSTPGATASLLRVLQKVGATDQAEALIARLPAEGLFNLYCNATNNHESYMFGREPDGTAAPKWGWDNLD